jgi:hypothetical protein
VELLDPQDRLEALDQEVSKVFKVSRETEVKKDLRETKVIREFPEQLGPQLEL